MDHQGPHVRHREPCSTSCGSRMGGEFGGEQTHVHVWLSPFALCLKLSQHCSSTIPQHKLKSLKVFFPPPTSPPPSLFFCQFLDGTIDYSAWIRHPGSILNPPSASPTISMDPHLASPSVHTFLSRSCPGPRDLALGPLTSLLDEGLPHCPQPILLPEGGAPSNHLPLTVLILYVKPWDCPAFSVSMKPHPTTKPRILRPCACTSPPELPEGFAGRLFP